MWLPVRMEQLGSNRTDFHEIWYLTIFETVEQTQLQPYKNNGCCTWIHVCIYDRILMNYHHHHISVMELGHLLTRSGHTYLAVSSEVCHDSFCQLGNSVSLFWVVCHEAFCLHVVSSSSCIPVVYLESVLFLILLQCVNLFCNLSKCILLFFSYTSSLLLLFSWHPLL